ncbi:thiopeptide-type bacteriocin biosynthesis protein [Streptomyces sp. NBC_01102]|uniref:thiopeptide-type bacteriocin biosynthesis protein n=1 Tax=Streptomyces sp. NBC_01102 TaxID=2903749 RepID=UPI003867D90C|nr:thiopeptide-type bacteriocin biosynthesis protein [Streptomyces sp. NBC_01102]
MDPDDLAAAVEVFQGAGYRALEAQNEPAWRQIYLEFADWENAERIVADHLEPVLMARDHQGDVSAWWFIRKHPCWRLRLRLGAPRTVAEARLEAALHSLVEGGHLRRWWPGIYEPETLAFGGGLAMDVAHDLFTADSRCILAMSQHGPHALGRRELSVLLSTTLMRGAGLEWYEQGDAWDRVTQERPLPSGISSERLDALARDLRTLVLADSAPDGPLWGSSGPGAFAGDWAGSFRRAGGKLGSAARSGRLERGLRHVLAYHVIFHWNRLGLPLRTQSALAWAARAAILDVPTSALSYSLPPQASRP